MITSWGVPINNTIQSKLTWKSMREAWACNLTMHHTAQRACPASYRLSQQEAGWLGCWSLTGTPFQASKQQGLMLFLFHCRGLRANPQHAFWAWENLSY